MHESRGSNMIAYKIFRTPPHLRRIKRHATPDFHYFQRSNLHDRLLIIFILRLQHTKASLSVNIAELEMRNREIQCRALMENYKRVYDSIYTPVWSPAPSPNLSESSLARWAAVSGFASAQPSTDRARCSRPNSSLGKLDLDILLRNNCDINKTTITMYAPRWNQTYWLD